ncbi:hypothetical protein FM109_07810 [Vibrio casei]|nr:hypothetical protein FM109_07810 [Vibrio casei]
MVRDFQPIHQKGDIARKVDEMVERLHYLWERTIKLAKSSSPIK